jgi:hypothetical protein
MHRTVTYSLASFGDCLDQDQKKILSFTIRTTDGEDEAVSARRAEAKGNSSMTEELIRFSLTRYERLKDDGSTEKVSVNVNGHWFEGFDKWSTKARNFVVAAWRKLSTPDEKEISDFFASATESE